MKKYDYKDREIVGFYEWNKQSFLINKNDERFENYLNIKKEKGFFPDETWALYKCISIFLVPRLKYFRELVKDFGCFPCSIESLDKWIEIIDKMIFSFESSLVDEPDDKFKSEYGENYRDIWDEKIKDGFKLFSEYYFALWW